MKWTLPLALVVIVIMILCYLSLPFNIKELTAWGSLLSGLGAVGLAVGAFVGLYRWKEQASFSARFELAREIITASYELIDAIEGTRISFNNVHFVPVWLDMLKELNQKVSVSKVKMQALELQVGMLFKATESEATANYLQECLKAHDEIFSFNSNLRSYIEISKSIELNKKEGKEVTHGVTEFIAETKKSIDGQWNSIARRDNNSDNKYNVTADARKAFDIFLDVMGKHTIV
jgi:hypothetical protein